MRKHLTDGELRADMDGELGSTRAAHIKTCPNCQTRQSGLQAESRQIANRLGFLDATEAAAPAVQAAWKRYSQRQLTHKETSMIYKWFALPTVRIAATAVLLLALVLAFPSTRAIAGELLNLFRVQQVRVIAIDYTGLEQLTGNESLGTHLSEMISSGVETTLEPGDPQEAADAGQASEFAGFNVRLPAEMTPSRLSVTGASAYSLTVDREKAQALLDEAGRADLLLPETIDGAEISVDIPASITASFGTCPEPVDRESTDEESQPPARYYPDCIILGQIPSPTVNAPAGVDVAQLAQIGLELTGMSSTEATELTNTVDWASTLVVPIPQNEVTYEEVSVDGVTGTLIQSSVEYSPEFALLWVRDGIIYTLSGRGASTQQAIDMANSLQ